MFLSLASTRLAACGNRTLYSVAQEHYCTASTQLIMSQLYPYIFRSDRTYQRHDCGCLRERGAA